MIKPEISGNTISVPSDTKFLAAVDDFIEGIIRGWGAKDSLLADIAISVSELVNNAMSHGNQSSSDKPVKVTVARKNGNVRVTVVDEGGGFNPSEIESPLTEENLLKEVGRGMFIVESLMDKVDVKHTDSGTTVTIEKRIS